ncbi:hypothetical protein BDV95DRAFT_313133 [Massariosphaeria phaeospora]|uniref:Uncharacterized protein n=1 Tax=Massariosphaeria phaeospora TaxID=100035 RepID=A0A7C8MFF2_9PLEO|nr:hypothetical protein BDV95DRAFT_313133 [Massariosphaeria phaeospora]
MACIGQQNVDSPTLFPQFPDIVSPSFSRARRPALIPSNCTLSLAEAEDLIRTRIQQPLLPSPDPRMLKNLRSVSPAWSEVARDSRESSPTSSYNPSVNTDTIPPAIARDPRRRAAWVKARAHYLRDQKLHQSAASPQYEPMDYSVEPKTVPSKPMFVDFGPKRKRSAFVQEQEFKCLLEDRVGTPHPGELQPDDDVSAQLNVEELRMGGAVAALADCSTDGNVSRRSI